MDYLNYVRSNNTVDTPSLNDYTKVLYHSPVWWFPKPLPPKAPKNYTWGDVSFLIEIADGLGTGSRRAREARLHKFDKDTKKRLIHLICRVKGEKVYDESKTVPDWEINVKVEDVDMVINEVLGSIKVEKADVL